MPPPVSLAEVFQLFQDLANRVADTLQIPLEEVKDTHHKAHVLRSSSSSKIALPIDEALLDPSKTIWQTSA